MTKLALMIAQNSGVSAKLADAVIRQLGGVAAARDCGSDPVKMVSRFRCVDDAWQCGTVASILRCLGGGRLLTDDDVQVANALAWFACEEVARAYSDLQGV